MFDNIYHKKYLDHRFLYLGSHHLVSQSINQLIKNRINQMIEGRIRKWLQEWMKE